MAPQSVIMHAWDYEDINPVLGSWHRGCFNLSVRIWMWECVLISCRNQMKCFFSDSCCCRWLLRPPLCLGDYHTHVHTHQHPHFYSCLWSVSLPQSVKTPHPTPSSTYHTLWNTDSRWIHKGSQLIETMDGKPEWCCPRFGDIQSEMMIRLCLVTQRGGAIREKLAFFFKGILKYSQSLFLTCTLLS